MFVQCLKKTWLHVGTRGVTLGSWINDTANARVNEGERISGRIKRTCPAAWFTHPAFLGPAHYLLSSKRRQRIGQIINSPAEWGKNTRAPYNRLDWLLMQRESATTSCVIRERQGIFCRTHCFHSSSLDEWYWDVFAVSSFAWGLECEKRQMFVRRQEDEMRRVYLTGECEGKWMWEGDMCGKNESKNK